MDSGKRGASVGLLILVAMLPMVPVRSVALRSSYLPAWSFSAVSTQDWALSTQHLGLPTLW